MRYIWPIFALLSLGIFLKIHFRPDLVPDFLKQKAGQYFNRDGFCFTFRTETIDGVCYLQAYFQNQYEGASVGRIALRPSRGFWMTRANIEAITFEIYCAPAAFGFVSLPIPLPKEVQGKEQSFDVGAFVEYPQGKGKRLRFSDGVLVRQNTQFKSGFNTALVVAGAMAGAIVLTTPAKAKVLLPVDAHEVIPPAVSLLPKTVTSWKLGDSTLTI